MIHQTISDQTWAGIRNEFTLPPLAQVHRRLSELVKDPEPIMRQLVRVFIDDGTFCPGFQFLPGGHLHPTVSLLFRRAMELKLPHNYFTVWMVTKSRDLAGARPVDRLNAAPTPLVNALESFHWQ
ncbi:hypothetical protein [Arthrobacter sp. BPSS-3]|uniref:hypothetical protein n=1 Tax=Arthrobacter sp. BPSS-3 TaxID=3366580 RepID=UPI0037DD72E7